MNRHGYHNEHEYDEEDAEVGNVEMPLPTYEEVVASSNTNIGFKEELLVPGSSHQGSRAGSSHELPIRLPVSAPNAEELRRPESRRKKCAKSYIVGLTGVVLIPLLILLIVLQLKSCNTCEHPVVQENTKQQADIKFNMEELEHCNAHLERTERRYSDAFSELQSVKKQRDELLIKQESADDDLKKLRYQYNSAFSDATNMRAEVDQLKQEVENYKALLAKAQSGQDKQKDS